MAMSAEELMEYKQSLEEALLALTSRIDETEDLITSCKALAKSDVVTRSDDFKTVFSALRDFPRKNALISTFNHAIEYHPDPNGFKEELRSMRKTLDDAKTEWKQSSVVREENGHLEFEDLEGEDDEVSVKRKKSLVSLRHLINMETSLLDIQFYKRCYINIMTKVVDPLLDCAFHIACICNSTISPGDPELLLNQTIDSLNDGMPTSSTPVDEDRAKAGFHIAADRFRASML
jgi:hypothetical protein